MRPHGSSVVRRSTPAKPDCCEPVLKFASIPAGKPIGAIQAILASRRHSISAAPRTSNQSLRYGRRRSVFRWRRRPFHRLSRRCRACHCGSSQEMRPKPRSLRVKLGYAICGNLCVPAEANLHLTLLRQSRRRGAEPGHSRSACAAPRCARRRVWRDRYSRRSLGSLRDSRSAVSVSWWRSSHLKIRRLICSSKDQRPIGHCRYRNRRASAADDAPGMRRFAFDMDGLPPGAVAKGATLTFTAVSPTDAIEVQARLD